AFEVVIAPVQRLPRLPKIAEIFLDDLLHKLVNRRASALRSESVEPLFRLGGKVYLHSTQDTANWGSKQDFRRGCGENGPERHGGTGPHVFYSLFRHIDRSSNLPFDLPPNPQNPNPPGTLVPGGHPKN